MKVQNNYNLTEIMEIMVGSVFQEKEEKMGQLMKEYISRSMYFLLSGIYKK